MNKLLEAYQHLRSGVYFLESLPLMGLNKFLSNQDRYKVSPKDLEYLKKSVDHLFKEDIQNIEDKVYPLSVLIPQNPVEHLTTLRKVYLDGLTIIYRRLNRKTKSFSKEAKKLISDLPDYYQRNFHFQTDGYLSEGSADIYDHQVEILFKGTSQAMRRLFLKDMKNHLKNLEKQSGSQKLRILEVAVGTGSGTEYLAKTFPHARITVQDLSSNYLKKAQENLKKYPQVDFVQGLAEDLQFKDQTFDAVFSVYLHHELPKEIRQKVVDESLRVLKPGGYFGIIDSLQTDDDPNLNWALTEFPKDFHEPFYKNYIDNATEDLVPESKAKLIQKRIGFLTKSLSYAKL